MRPSRLLSAGAAVAMVLGLPATPASAAVTCSFNAVSGVLTVTIGDAADGTTHLSVSEGTIEVGDGDGEVACLDGPATTAATDSIDLVDTAGGNNNVFLNPGFGPGAEDESPGLPEIEISLDLGGGDDQLFLNLPPGADVRLGADGVNLNAGAEDDAHDDADVKLTSVDDIQVVGSVLADVIDASGGAGTGAAYPAPLDIRAGGGDDTVVGGAGDDGVHGSAGDDEIDGGPGADTAAYNFAPGPLVVNLPEGTATGDGNDTLVNVERATGPFGIPTDDVFIGDANANVFLGFGGDDLFIGSLGADHHTGGDGDDTIWTRDAAGPVTIDLDSNSVSGAESATVVGMENAIGGPFDDTITGNGLDNVLTGGPGDDFLNGLLGNDIASYATNPGPIVANMPTSIVTGASTDTLLNVEGVRGSPFADTFISTPGTADSFDGAGGKDTLRFPGAPGRVVVDLARGIARDGGGATDSVTRIETVVGTRMADVLRGDGRANRLVGGRGNDRLVGRAGPDVLLGGAHDDALNGGRGRDLCRQGPGTGPVRGCER